MLKTICYSFFCFFLLSLPFSLLAQGLTPEEQADALYDQIMKSDGFNEADAWRSVGQIYPEYNILAAAEKAYDQALASDNPAEIARIGSQLAQQQQQPLRRLQGLILHLKTLPASDTLNRALAVLLLERNYQLPSKEQEYQELLQLIGAPTPDQLADPLDWTDPALALEALLQRYRTPLDTKVDAQSLQDRLRGLEHCLQLLHYLRRAHTSEADRLALAATVPPLAHRALVIALQLDQQEPQSNWRAKAFQLAEQAKATLLADRLQGIVVDRSQLNWPNLGQQLRLARQLAAQSGAFFGKQQALRELVNASFSELTAWPPPPQSQLDVARIQDKVSAQDALLVSYFRIGDQGIVFSLDGNDIRVEHFYWNKETQQALQELRREMEGRDFLREPTAAYQRFCRSSFWLYENLLLRPALRKKDVQPTQLILLPDAELWDIPFAALLSSSPSSDQPSYSSQRLDYLINSYSLSLAPSAQSWYSLSQLADAPLKVAALAPDFGGEAMADNRQGCSGLLSALPHSVGEAEAILSSVDGQAFLGSEAALGNLQQAEVSAFSVWHLATHACRQNDDPTQSSIYFQDGPLTAQQISKLPLQLQLVVLSACETQSGPYQSGEGVLSIGRAFLQAGARSMMGSLWPVSDAATAELMPLFYQSLAAGRGSAQALREAQMGFLQQQDRLTAHPHYWAGFVLVGPSVHFGGGGNTWYPWLLLLGGGLAFLTLISRRRTSN